MKRNSTMKKNRKLPPLTVDSENEDLLELYERAGFLIRRCHQVIEAYFTEFCNGHNITSVQFAAMMILRRRPGIDQATLSDLVAFDRATTGDVVARLVRKGLVRRRVSNNDQRKKLLSLTSKGKKTLTQIHPLVEKAQETFLEPLSAKDWENLKEVLLTLAAPDYQK
jgi:DNA-binding MarR family transcriptional regulator|tara:strand:- start:883 stop:1383 length:501 start_codon:yes stop_codon:yes gene_type:complete